MQVLTNPEAPEKEVEEANQKIQQLMKIDNQETVLEELIRKEGYQDAVVITNLPHVDVIVQSEKLDKKQVVKLISLVPPAFASRSASCDRRIPLKKRNDQKTGFRKETGLFFHTGHLVKPGRLFYYV